LDRPGVDALPELVRRAFGYHGDGHRPLRAGLPSRARPAAPEENAHSGRDQDDRRCSLHTSSSKSTWTVCGPCTPTTKVSSISEVRDGPVMKVIAWLAPWRTRASASPSDSQMHRVDNTATWIGAPTAARRSVKRAVEPRAIGPGSAVDWTGSADPGAMPRGLRFSRIAFTISRRASSVRITLPPRAAVRVATPRESCAARGDGDH